MTGAVDDRLKFIIYAKAVEHESEVMELNVMELEAMPDHVHLLAEVDPNPSLTLIKK